MNRASTPIFNRRARMAFAGVLLAGLLVALLFAGGNRAGASADAKRSKGKPKQPNIVLIVTDDQAGRTEIPEAMPQLFSRVIPRGTTFSDYMVTTPLCCPSRSTMLTGQYGHNNGVLRNFYPDLKQKQNVLPVWLQRAGYTTAHVGKFLNSYEEGADGPAAVAPGWDLWFTELEKRRYYDWKASKNGKIRHFGTRDEDQATAVSIDYARRWTKRLAGKDEPFYMQLDFYAPHTSNGRDSRCASGPVPVPGDEHRFDDFVVPDPPNYNEQDVSDKPKPIEERPPLTEADKANIDRRFRCTLEALYGVDRGIGQVIDQVKKKGELNNTVFVFTSDNGFFFGEHRIPKGKPDPYEENIHMPLTIVVPRKYRGGGEVVPTSDEPVANIDLAPTLLDLADADPCRTKRICRTMDGRSLMPLIRGKTDWPNPRGLEIELSTCKYRGARYDHRVYLEYSNDMADGSCSDPTDIEHYDLTQDPFQLENLHPAAPGSPTAEIEAQLAATQLRLSDCSGIKGRDPRPKSGHFCD